MTRPVVWSIAGSDAGPSADPHVADAFDVHWRPVSAAMLETQLAALAVDGPPQVIRTDLPGSAEAVAILARWVDRLRERAPVALVVEPALGANRGAALADESTLQALGNVLLPRTTVLALNRHGAGQLAGRVEPPTAASLPTLARGLIGRGAEAVAITGGESPAIGGQAVDWIATPHASGWLALPRIDTWHDRGSGRSFSAATAAALARGFVAADALVLAKMAATDALRRAHAAGRADGRAGGFVNDASLLPLMSWGEAPRFPALHAPQRHRAARPLGLYAIVDSADRIRRVLDAGVRTLQLRIKTEPTPAVRDAVRRAIADCRAALAELFVNDHWQLAIELGAGGVHLGQEDLLALDEAQREALAGGSVALGISSHSLWELCRARSLGPRYIACGPVWPTLTKTMPWRPQGLDNLGWWVAMAGAPVVAIGGILSAGQFREAAACGAEGVCAVRVLGDDPAATVPALQRALNDGHESARSRPAPAWPHPSLESRAR